MSAVKCDLKRSDGSLCVLPVSGQSSVANQSFGAQSVAIVWRSAVVRGGAAVESTLWFLTVFGRVVAQAMCAWGFPPVNGLEYMSFIEDAATLFKLSTKAGLSL